MSKAIGDNMHKADSLTQHDHQEVYKIPNQFVRNDRSFFCSELVAKALTLHGMIEDDDRSCALFYPQHFSSSNNEFFKIMPEVSIEAEKDIMLEK